jgi:hypothetical protein
MQGKAYIGDKVACEAVITCRLLDRRGKHAETAPNPDSGAGQA